LQAFTGDGYVILTFDYAICGGSKGDTSFKVVVTPKKESTVFKSSPIRIKGLKNGTSYRFTLTAENSRGSSGPVKSNWVKPQNTSSLIEVDSNSIVSRFAALNYKGKPVIVFGDELSKTLKIATNERGKWKVSIVRRKLSVGPISVCKSGNRSKEELHIFYAELEKKDLLYSTLLKGKWSHGVIDGNGASIQSLEDFPRKRTASDVSTVNACATTPNSVQVFYRDQTQGLLLGAIKTSNDWVYEVVDGNSEVGGRTTGDVAFSLSATSKRDYVYLIYDSVVTVDSSGRTVYTEMRLALRNSVFPEDWIYQAVEGPNNGVAIVGFSTTLEESNGSIKAAWISSGKENLGDPSKLVIAKLFPFEVESQIENSAHGSPTGPLVFTDDMFVFGCMHRLCVSRITKGQLQLLSAKNFKRSDGAILDSANGKYLVITSKKRLFLIKL